MPLPDLTQVAERAKLQRTIVTAAQTPPAAHGVAAERAPGAASSSCRCGRPEVPPSHVPHSCAKPHCPSCITRLSQAFAPCSRQRRPQRQCTGVKHPRLGAEHASTARRSCLLVCPSSHSAVPTSLRSRRTHRICLTTAWRRTCVRCCCAECRALSTSDAAGEQREHPHLRLHHDPTAAAAQRTALPRLRQVAWPSADPAADAAPAKSTSMRRAHRARRS